MRWKGREQSDNVQDKRGMTPGRVAGGGIGMIVLAAIAYFVGGGDAAKKVMDRQRAMQQQQGQQAPAGNAGKVGKMDDSREFIGFVLKTTEVVWTKQFAARGREYDKPTLNIFSGHVDSGCGPASSAMGPFYCPGDSQVYIDPTFFDELATKYGAPGDFAPAFVIAHEVGHHIQNELGWNDRSNKARRAKSPTANQESVRLELQADYLAGVWAHHAHKEFDILEKGDLQEAMRAAIKIGDDTLQLQATGRVIEADFTHGSAEQRQRWFMEGVKSGNFDRAVVLFEIPYNEL